MLFYNTPHYTIRYSAPLSLVEIIWHGFVTSEQLQEGLTCVLKVVRENRATFLLANARSLNALKASDQTWIKKHLFPALSASGIKKFAHITNPDIFTQAIISNFSKEVELVAYLAFEFQSFYDREDALEWILSDQSMSASAL